MNEIDTIFNSAIEEDFLRNVKLHSKGSEVKK